MINVRNGNVYSPDSALIVLSLKNVELATEEDQMALEIERLRAELAKHG